MEGYWKIPTYTDSACTQFYKTLYVGYMPNSYLNSMTSKRMTYTRNDGSLSTQQAYLYRQTGSSYSDAITIEQAQYPYAGSYPAYANQVSVPSQQAGFNFLKARIAEAINSNCANGIASIDDKFNFYSFFEEDTTVYIKNGGRMQRTKDSSTGVVTVKCFSNHTTTSPANTIEWFEGTVPQYYSLSSTSIKERSRMNQGEATTAAMGGSPYYAYCAAYAVIMVTNFESGQYWIDWQSFSKCVRWASTTGTWGTLPANSQCYAWLRSYQTGVWNTLRGGKTQSQLPDVEYIKVTEDMDNTYPGGGDDKNDYPDEDSEEPGGESGKGDFDNTNDPIDFPILPTWDVQSTGFISLWNPTIVQLTNLYTFLWDSDISTTLKKLFNEPMNAIFSLGIVPVDPVTQGTRRLTIGHVDTEIDMESIQKQFVTFDFGSIDINEYYGAAWDYSPYTHASIYLPYIGVQPVDIDDIMNCTLTLRYNIDVLTGTTIALLKCVRKGRDNLNAVMYEWQGNCVTQCPITAGNWSQIMASVIQLGAMTGLALSQPVVGAIGSAVGSSAAAEYAQGKNLVNPTMATYGALNVLGSKVHVQRGGRLDMSSGAMSMQKAFIILNRPVSGIPRGWNKYAGYPSLKIKTLGSQEGFVSVGAIKLDGLRATAEEINELDTILKTGVII